MSLLKVFGLVDVLEDSNRVRLCFENKRQAKLFMRFIWTYIQEGTGSSDVSAYWLVGNRAMKVVRSLWREGHSSLRAELIESMAWSIGLARSGLSYSQFFRNNQNQDHKPYIPKSETVDGVIRFEFDETKFLPRLEPVVGDLVVIIDLPEQFDRVKARVMAIKDGLATLMPISGSLELSNEICLPIQNVMKVYDVYKEQGHNIKRFPMRGASAYTLVT